MTPPRKKALLCPICKKPIDFPFRPFCSTKCKQLDLARWLSGTYVIPGEETTKEDEKKPEENDSSSENKDI